MLVHHSSRQDYDVAASEAATRARGLLESRIEHGRQNGAQVIEKIMTETPRDQIVKGGALRFDGNQIERDEGVPLGLLVGVHNDHQVGMGIHKHAMGQVCAKAKFPARYAGWLQENDRVDWGLPLLAENLNTIYRHSGSRYLMRSYDDTLRGFLSDRYRRMDSRPLVEAFTGACQEVGALPIEGYASDTKVGLKAILPLVFEPVPNEVMSFGVMWENSDYGNGRHSLQAFMVRLWCTNYAIMSDSFSQVHIGKRLSDDISYSDRTYELDTQTISSAIRDVVATTIGPESVKTVCEVVKRAHEDEMTPQEMTRAIKAIGGKLTKGEQEAVTTKFNEPDVVELPPGNTLWRLSNSLSWVANQSEEPERKVELMKIAGGVLDRKLKVA